MLPSEAKTLLNNCNQCGKKPEVFYDDYCGDTRQDSWMAECSCGMSTITFDDPMQLITVWNRCFTAPTPPPSGTGEAEDSINYLLNNAKKGVREIHTHIPANRAQVIDGICGEIDKAMSTMQAELTRLREAVDKLPTAYQIVDELQKTDAKEFTRRERGLLGNLYNLVQYKLKQALGGEGGNTIKHKEG